MKMRLKDVFVIVSLLLCLSNTAGAQDKLDSLRSWIGKYPTDETHRPPRHFFQFPEIRRPLLKLLSRRDFNRLTGNYKVESPIELVDGYLVATMCLPHVCDAEHALFAANLHDGSMYVGFYRLDISEYNSVVVDDSKGEITWFSTRGDWKNLPRAVVGRFQKMHSSK